MKQVFLILLAVSCTALAQIGINIVKNSGFEHIDAKGNPSYWDSHPSAVPTVFTTVTDTKFEGERGTCTPMFIAALFTITRTWKQPRCPSADEWIRKLWYICTMEYYSAIKKNTFESVLMRWMKLEPIIQSEVSQKEKHHYSILTHIYGI